MSASHGTLEHIGRRSLNAIRKIVYFLVGLRSVRISFRSRRTNCTTTPIRTWTLSRRNSPCVCIRTVAPEIDRAFPMSSLLQPRQIKRAICLCRGVRRRAAANSLQREAVNSSGSSLSGLELASFSDNRVLQVRRRFAKRARSSEALAPQMDGP